jgi:hypothetical protein
MTQNCPLSPKNRPQVPSPRGPTRSVTWDSVQQGGGQSSTRCDLAPGPPGPPLALSALESRSEPAGRALGLQAAAAPGVPDALVQPCIRVVAQTTRIIESDAKSVDACSIPRHLLSRSAGCWVRCASVRVCTISLARVCTFSLAFSTARVCTIPGREPEALAAGLAEPARARAIRSPACGLGPEFPARPSRHCEARDDPSESRPGRS